MANTSVQKSAAEKPTLPWKYCECGCKGHTVEIGTLSVWMHNDLKGGFSLFAGHPPHCRKINDYNSYKGADEVARRYLKPEFEKLRTTIEQLAPLFDATEGCNDAKTKVQQGSVVHALWYGLPLCGFTRNVPKDWPKGHVWTDKEDLTNLTCPQCKAEATKLKDRR